VYCALAIGIAQDRQRDACVLMEDVGELSPDLTPGDPTASAEVLDDLVKSVISIGLRHRVVYREIFVGMRDLKVASGETGCALVACPYFTLAPRAIPAGGLATIESMSLSQWVAAVVDGR
jgi:hypothetical protein